MGVNKTDLDRALGKGAMKELPPNIPPGWLGERGGVNMRKIDTFEPTLNAGVLQESSWETRWLLIVLLYLLVIGSPVALWLLWRDPKRSLAAKTIATVAGIAIYAAAWLLTRH